MKSGRLGRGVLLMLNLRGCPPFLFFTTMAKQVSTIQVTGKLGNMVGYTNSLAKKSGTKFARSIAQTISNPKTYAQAKQRAKARPAQLFYAAFEQILNHAFIPLGKAGKNRNRFLSLAMSQSVIPGVMKSETALPVNVPYQISEGSLGLNGLTRINLGAGTSADKRAEFANIAAGAGMDDDVSTIRDMYVGDFSTQLLAENPLLQEGEELTFMAVLGDVNDPTQRIGAYLSVVLNTADTLTTMGEVMGSMLDLIAINGHLTLISANEVLYGIASVGLIISSRTTKSWIYTSSVMQPTSWGIDGFDYDEESVIASYMEGASADITSDKILQQADNNVVSGVSVVALVNKAFTATSERATAQGVTFSSQVATLAVMSDGSRRVVTIGNNQLAIVPSNNTTSAASITATVPASGDTPESQFQLLVSDTSWLGNATIPFSEVSGATFRV